MILSTSANKKSKPSKGNVPRYLGATLFCLIFFLIYDPFSHGVRSPYMTWLFAWPLGLGLLPELAFRFVPGLRRPGRLAGNLYHSGVAALTVSSCLRGIFEIAGTASDYQKWLMLAGAAMAVCGVIAWLLRK